MAAIKLITRLQKRIRRSAREALSRVRIEHRLQEIEKQRPILIYQMGKVGSSTVARTLEAMDLAHPVLQVHVLTRDHVERAIAKHRASIRQALPRHLLLSEALSRKLDDERFPCQVITLTREPIARAISFLFQDRRKKMPGVRRGGTWALGEAQAALTDMLRSVPSHVDPAHWFDAELHRVFGVDVFSKPYDAKQGYTLFEGDIPVLVMRLEDFDHGLRPGVSELLGVDPGEVEPLRANVGAEKVYAEPLRALKERYRLPPDLAERMLQSRYVRHFYAAEMQALRERWAS